MSATFHAKAYEETKCHGLQEGVKHQLNCNDCDNPLLVIWEVNPYFTFRDGTPYSYNYKAKCPFCGGMSETKKINGEVRFLEIVEEQELEGGHIKERHITKFQDVQNFSEDETCLITMAKGN